MTKLNYGECLEQFDHYDTDSIYAERLSELCVKESARKYFEIMIKIMF